MKAKLIKLVAILIVMLMMTGSLSYAEENKKTPKIKLSAVLTPSYIIGPGDELQIIDRTLKDLFGQVETYKLTVSGDGYISVPLPDGSQQSVLAAGQTLDEFSKEVRELFGQTLKNPLVFVQINKFRPINVYIGGAVVKPGVYKIEKTTTKDESGNSNSSLSTFGLTLTEAVQIAGGLKPRADITKVSVTRGSNSEKRTIDLKDLISGASTLKDVTIQPGDAIHIPFTSELANQAQSHVRLLGKLAYQDVPVSVVGEGKSTGNFVLPNDATLLDALGRAGGLNEVGSLKKIRLSRFDKDGKYVTRKINLHDLIHMGSEFGDIAVKPGDRIELVASKGKLVRHFFNENASAIISPVLSSFGNYFVQDQIVGRTRFSETTSRVVGSTNNGDDGDGGVIIIGE